MIDTGSTIFQIILGIIICTVALVAIAVALFVGSRFANSLSGVRQALIEEFGFLDENPKGLYPKLKGVVDEVPVAVDVIFEHYAQSGVSSSQRPYTRVRAQLPATPPFQIRALRQRYRGQIDGERRITGVPEFDERYELFVAAERRTEDVLTPAAQRALIVAQPSVHIIGDVVLWARPKHVRDPRQLSAAVRACVAVATAIRKSSPAQR